MKQTNANGNRLCVVSTSMVLHVVLLAYPLSIIQEDKNREENDKKSSVSLIR